MVREKRGLFAFAEDFESFRARLRKIGSLASLKRRSSLRLITVRMDVLFGSWILGLMVLVGIGSYAFQVVGFYG
jgi:hypothetical protein